LAQRNLAQFSIDFGKSFLIGLEPVVWFQRIRDFLLMRYINLRLLTYLLTYFHNNSSDLTHLNSGVPGRFRKTYDRQDKKRVAKRLICTIVQNFTPIGATIAEITVTEQAEKQQTCHPAILTYDG